MRARSEPAALRKGSKSTVCCAAMLRLTGGKAVALARTNRLHGIMCFVKLIIRMIQPKGRAALYFWYSGPSTSTAPANAHKYRRNGRMKAMRLNPVIAAPHHAPAETKKCGTGWDLAVADICSNFSTRASTCPIGAATGSHVTSRCGQGIGAVHRVVDAMLGPPCMCCVFVAGTPPLRPDMHPHVLVSIT